MKIAVVILNWNGQKFLERFLPKVLAHSPLVTIYVADNASTDNSVDFVSKHYPQVKIIENPTNGGYAQGYNMALAKIKADVYCLLNSDVEVTPNWLLPIEKIFATYPNVAVIQPKILDYNHKNKFEYAGAAGGFLDKYGFPYCRGRIFDTLEVDKGQYDNETDIFWASGACLFIRSEVFQQLGGFDEDFFAHQEEIDLCWRLHTLKYRIVFCPQSVVYHIGGGTLPTESPQKIYLNFRNSLYVLLKNLPSKALFQTIFIRLVLDGVAATYYLLKGKFSFTKAVFWAHMDFYKCLRHFWRKRLKNTYPNYFNHHSVVWNYFIKNKKNYSDF